AAHSTAAYDTLPVNESNLLTICIRNATIAAGTGVAPWVGDIGVNTSRALASGAGPRRVEATSRIADLGDLRVFGALEDVEAAGLTATPAFDDAAREGDLVRMPDWSTWRGSTIAVGEPAALFLLAPASGGTPAGSATISS